MKNLLYILLFLLVNKNQVNATICTANLIGGNWNNASTWDCGIVPGCGDEIVIPFGSIVTITANVNLAACPDPIDIIVYGELVFTSNKSISLPAASCIQIQFLGTIIPSLALGSTNRINVGGAEIWSGTLLTLPILGPTALGCVFNLPVELLNFEVQNQDKNVLLSWQTQTERENDFFTVEFSRNGQYWQELATVDGFGNSLDKKSYSVKDNEPFIGLTYYRLYQTDLSGKIELLKTISNTFDGKDYLIYPLPVNKILYLEGSELNNVKVDLLNNLGEKIELNDYSFEGDKLVYDLSNIPNGNYFFQLNNNNVQIIKKIIVLHKSY